jgi:N,N'-diacetyllegionaminate synthase
MKTLIIAEAGVNHNGSIDIARKMIDAASEAGADYVKFQTFKAELIASKYAEQAEYQKNNGSCDGDTTQINMLRKLELSHENHCELIAYCKTKNIHFLSTAFDLPSINFLNSLNLGLWKIPSGEITNYPYLKRIATTRKPVILSTGMSEITDINNAINVLTQFGTVRDDITVLHCNTEYPTPFEDVNLQAMLTIAEQCSVKVGYSDHTLGIEVPVAAVALGAVIIEKHFTLDRSMNGPDHKASLEPQELKTMVRAIRNVEKALGSREKQITVSERKNMSIARKSIIAARNIRQGEIFTEDNLTVKRPGNGVSPMLWESVIGTMAKRDFAEDELIEL